MKRVLKIFSVLILVMVVFSSGLSFAAEKTFQENYGFRYKIIYPDKHGVKQRGPNKTIFTNRWYLKYVDCLEFDENNGFKNFKKMWSINFGVRLVTLSKSMVFNSSGKQYIFHLDESIELGANEIQIGFLQQKHPLIVYDFQKKIIVRVYKYKGRYGGLLYDIEPFPKE